MKTSGIKEKNGERAEKRGAVRTRCRQKEK